MGEDREPCPTCGAPVRCLLGPDIRFSPPDARHPMYRAECSGDCIDPALEWTSFTREGALRMWNEGVRKHRATKEANHE